MPSLLGALSVPAPARSAALSRALLPSGPPGSIPGGGSYIFDQGLFPGCVACASATALALLKSPTVAPSPLFVYYVVACQLQKVNADGELRIDGMLQALALRGVCSLEQHDGRFTQSDATRSPSDSAFADARTRRLAGGMPFPRGYEQPVTTSRTDWLKRQVDARHPVLLLIKLPRTYDPSARPPWRWRNANESLTGRMHCIVAIGYNDLEGAVRVQDSRGRQSFEQGCWWLGYSVLENGIAVEACIALTR